MQSQAPAPTQRFVQHTAPQAQQMPSPSDLSKRLLSKPTNEMREPARQEFRASETTTNRQTGGSGVDSLPTIGQQAAVPVPATDPKFTASLEELHNTLRGRLYDTSGKMVSEVPIRELIQTVQDTQNLEVIVFDGIITQRLVELANKQGIKSVYGVRAGQLSRLLGGMLLYTKEQGKLQ